MARNPPDGIRVVARLAYDDPDAAVAFLAQAFAFTERTGARVESAGGGISLTEVEIADSLVMVGVAGPHGLASPQGLGAASQALIVYLDGIDAHYERARAAGAEIVSEPTDMFWGDRRYEARDPEGHLWSFHEHLRDVSAEEMSAALAALREKS